MTRHAWGFAVALLLISLTVPVFGRNYSLHSPKIWTPEEKELFDKANEPPEKEQEVVKKDLEPVNIQKGHVKKSKVKVRKQKVQVKKDQVLVKDGVSYREVAVQKGDSLYGISLKFKKEGASYSEVLALNGIKDPNRLKIGDIIKIPVITERTNRQLNPAKQPAPATQTPLKKQTPANLEDHPVSEGPLRGVKPPDVIKDEIPAANPQTQLPRAAEKAIIKPPSPQATPVTTKTVVLQYQSFSNMTTPGHRLFEKAVTSYRQGDCQTAIQLFGRFLAENKNSSLAADVSVFIADCYLKLSGK